MLHPKYKRQTDYCCCSGTVHCRYCVGQGKPPHLTVDKDYNTISIASKAYMDERERLETLSDMAREYRNLQAKEPVNELQKMQNSLNTQNDFIEATKCGAYIVGSVSAEGMLSFSSKPAVHNGAQSARAECSRLSDANPGKLYLFVKLMGGQIRPASPPFSF